MLYHVKLDLIQAKYRRFESIYEIGDTLVGVKQKKSKNNDYNHEIKDKMA